MNSLNQARDLLKKSISCALSEIKNPLLRNVAQYVMLPGGKLLRGLLVVKITEHCQGDINVAIRIATAIEFAHAYSLVHDDLPCMDDDEFRRGKLTCHKKFCESDAILMGDALLTIAFNIISKESNIECDARCEIIELLSDAIGCNGLILGQYLDLCIHNPTQEEIHEIHIHKTAKLFSCACTIGGILSNIEKIKTLSKFGELYGLAFQIKDDIEDIDEKSSTNYVTCFGMDLAQSKLEFLKNEMRITLCNMNSLYEYLKDFLVIL